jgi:hypothetical protein
MRTNPVRALRGYNPFGAFSECSQAWDCQTGKVAQIDGGWAAVQGAGGQ